MIYPYSKRNLAPQICNIINSNLNAGGDYIELFCGGCSVAERLPDRYKIHLNDNNTQLIALFAKAQGGWIPDHMPHSKEQWLANLNNSDPSIAGCYRYLYGCYGSNKCYSSLNYNRNRSSFLNTVNKLITAKFYNLDYKRFPMHLFSINNTLIYLDPPISCFNTQVFIDYVIRLSRAGYKVLVSYPSLFHNFIPVYVYNSGTTSQCILQVFKECIDKWNINKRYVKDNV